MLTGYHRVKWDSSMLNPELQKEFIVFYGRKLPDQSCGKVSHA